MGQAIRSLRRVSQIHAQNKYPFDTGCTFMGARIRLECDDPKTAAALGNSLAAKGLRHEHPSMVISPKVMGIRVKLGRENGQDVYLCWPTQKSRNIVVLETTDSMHIQPFIRWLRSVYPKPQEKESKSLNDLVDAGEIDVIEC